MTRTKPYVWRSRTDDGSWFVRMPDPAHSRYFPTWPEALAYALSEATR